MTFASLLTCEGKVKMYLAEGAISEDPVAEDFFGCPGVAEIPKLQKLLLYICRNGHRHHVSVTGAHCADPMVEALVQYLGFEVDLPQQG